MAENIQRANLSTAEIAEFIVSRRKIPESQGEIADRLGLNKAIVSQYCSWSDFPETIREAVLTNKIGSIQSAYALFKTWKEYPEKTERFIEETEKISASQAKKFDPSIKPEETLPPELEETNPTLSSTPPEESPVIEETIGSSEELSETRNHSEEESEEELPTASADSQEKKDNFLEETSEESETDSEQLPDAPDEIVIDPNAQESEESESFSNESESEDFSEEKDSNFSQEPDQFDSIRTEKASEDSYKKPLILCLIEGRECELLYKKKALDGMVFVKWEDGSEEEIPAEEVEINRIIEG